MTVRPLAKLAAPPVGDFPAFDVLVSTRLRRMKDLLLKERDRTWDIAWGMFGGDLFGGDFDEWDDGKPPFCAWWEGRLEELRAEFWTRWVSKIYRQYVGLRARHAKLQCRLALKNDASRHLRSQLQKAQEAKEQMKAESDASQDQVEYMKANQLCRYCEERVFDR